MAKRILIKPIISEKAEMLSESLQQYSFIVNPKANKLEIKDAVETLYNVSVKAVNTMRMPGKAKNRMNRTGMIKGRIAPYKKAVVTLHEGEEIDFFGDI